jgi:hypothetical protein
LNKLDRLENVLTQHKEGEEVDYNNNIVSNQNEFIVNQQQQASKFDIRNEDFLRQQANLADVQDRHEFVENQEMIGEDMKGKENEQKQEQKNVLSTN